MSNEEIRLECFKEILKHQGGDIDSLIEKAKKASEFVMNGCLEPPLSNQRKS